MNRDKRGKVELFGYEQLIMPMEEELVIGGGPDAAGYARKWHGRFLDMADTIAGWSKDPSTKVGCVIIDSDTRAILSMGYNGFPRGVEDRAEWYEDREYKYPVVVHAEINAIVTSTTRLTGATLYCNIGLPCPDCAGPIIQAGISKVVCPTGTRTILNTSFFNKLTLQMFEDAGIELVEIDDWEPKANE